MANSCLIELLFVTLIYQLKKGNYVRPSLRKRNQDRRLPRV